MELPSIYSHLDDLKRGVIHSEVIQQAIDKWNASAIDLTPFHGWSNDWASCKFVRYWAVPLSYFGLTDPTTQYEDEPFTIFNVKDSLRALGELIPIAYWAPEDDDRGDMPDDSTFIIDTGSPSALDADRILSPFPRNRCRLAPSL